MLAIERSRLVAAVALAILAAGCSSTTPTPDPAAETPKEPVADVGPATEVGDHEVRLSLEPVYFDTDEAALRGEARIGLRNAADAIVSHPEWGVVTVEGHCDERGSDGYNLDLGRRRAAAVQAFLIENGVPASRLSTHSFGSSRPAVAGHDESAWRYNRRSELQHEVLAATGF